MFGQLDKSEYENRYERAREVMDEENIDALLITEGKNYYYFTGHDAAHWAWTTYTRPLIALIPREKEPLILVHSWQANDAEKESWITDVRPHSSTGKAPINELTEIFDNLGDQNGKIGMEFGYEQRVGMAYNDLQKLMNNLDAQFVDASKEIWSLRMKKTENEADYLRKACQITADAYDECFQEAEEGMTEREISTILHEKMIEKGSEGRSFIVLTSGEGNYDRMSGTPTDREVKDGDMIWMDTGAYFGNYTSDYSRAGVVGGPSKKQEEMQKAISDTTLETANSISPSMKMEEVVENCNKALKKRGLEISFEAGRIGHGIGLMVTEPPHVAKYDDTELEPGMVITIEPGVIREHGVYHVEENVLVTEDGSEILSETSRELRSI